jgi:hypothetical protein
MKLLIALLVLPMCISAAAQGMYKCKDAAGKITYSGKECHLMGLGDAGEVTGKASVTPAQKQPPGSAPSARPAAPSPQPPAAASQSAQKSPEAAESERRCFVVKSGKKGSATRCNEVPGEEEAPAKQ